ncbi:hypothetical protein ABIE48_000436 [Paenibacillus sp. OAE614]
MLNYQNKKKYFLSADQIVQLIDSNEGCIASDRITVAFWCLIRSRRSRMSKGRSETFQVLIEILC